MKGTEELSMAIRAGYSMFYCQTYEMNRSVTAIRETINDLIGKSSVTGLKIWDLEKDKDPELVIAWLEDQPTGTVVLAKNYNWFLKDDYGNPNKTVVQYLQNRNDLFCSAGERKVLIIVSDVAVDKSIPETLHKDFLTINFDLPSVAEIEKTLNGIIDNEKSNAKFTQPTAVQVTNLVDAAKGMTLREVENAYSYSLVQHKGKLESKTVAGIRAKDIENTAGIKMSTGTLTFETLLGYNQLKKFTKATINSPFAKGIILLGPPGTGKTHFCNCLGNEVGRPLFEMEMANLFGGLVGESEKLVRAAIAIILANAPCVLLVDEIEKGLAGVGGSGSNDGGTTKRAMAQFLKFLSEPHEGVYVVATCNDISALPPEWIRPGRWDSAPFFIDLPNETEKKQILAFYQKKYGVNSDPDMEGWSGAEIESCCRIAAMMGCTTKEAQKFIVPVSKTMEAEISNLRKWAEGRTIPASEFEMVVTSAKSKAKAIDY